MEGLELLASRATGGNMTGEENRPRAGRDLNTGLRSRGFAKGIREEV